MDIKSLLCSQQSIETNNLYSYKHKPEIYIHQRQPSWSSSSCPSSPGSPTSLSSSSYYSVPSSPDIESPTSPITAASNTTAAAAKITLVTDSVGPIIQRSNNSKRLVHSQTRTPWSSVEDRLLQQGYSQGLSWAMISTVYLPHRSRGCCWGRFKTLKAKSLEQREWSDSEDRLLMLAIKKNSRLFKQAWKAVAQDLGNRNWKECEMRSTKADSSSIVKKKASRQC